MIEDKSAQSLPVGEVPTELFKINEQSDNSDFEFLPQTNKPSHLTRDVAIAFFNCDDESADECVDKLLKAEIAYEDLASLSNKDLELLGFKDEEQRTYLLNYFRNLPNQGPSYSEICATEEAKSYNSDIFDGASDHLKTMCSTLKIAKYKLELRAPDDVVVGDKSFASRFVLEALAELKGVTDELDADLKDMEMIMAAGGKNNTKRMEKKGPKFSFGDWFILSSVMAAAIGVLWYWKIKFTSVN